MNSGSPITRNGTFVNTNFGCRWYDLADVAGACRQAMYWTIGCLKDVLRHSHGLSQMNKLEKWLRYPIESRENFDRVFTWAIRLGYFTAFFSIASAVILVVWEVRAH